MNASSSYPSLTLTAPPHLILVSNAFLVVYAFTAISAASDYSRHAWSQQPHAAGSSRPNLRIPPLADRNTGVAQEYGRLIENKGITFRASYLIDPKGVLRQITMNDLPVGRSVDEAFQFTVSDVIRIFVGRVMLTRCGADEG